MPEIRNPNLQSRAGPGGSGSGGDMRSTLLFTMLLIVVFLGYQYFFKPTPPPIPPVSQSAPQQAQSTGQSRRQGRTATGNAGTGEPTARDRSARAGSRSSAPTVTAALETQTTIENEQYKIVFTNRGAQIEHWILKKYTDSAGKPMDMVQPQLAKDFGFPLSFFTYEPALTAQLNQALYQVSASGAQPSATGYAVAPETNALTFHYASGNLDVVKTVRFDSSYVITVEAEVKRNGAPVRALISWPSGLGDMEEFLPASSTRSSIRTSAMSTFAWSVDGKQDSESVTKVGNDATFDEPYAYAAVSDLYFASAFLPDVPDRATIVTLHHTVDLPGDLSNPNSATKPAQVLGLAVGDTSGDTRLRLFAGPKAMDIVTSIHAIGADGKPDGQSLAPLIQFGCGPSSPSRSISLCASSTNTAWATGDGPSSLSRSSSTC